MRNNELSSRIKRYINIQACWAREVIHFLQGLYKEAVGFLTTVVTIKIYKLGRESDQVSLDYAVCGLSRDNTNGLLNGLDFFITGQLFEKTVQEFRLACYIGLLLYSDVFCMCMVIQWWFILAAFWAELIFNIPRSFCMYLCVLFAIKSKKS